MVYDTYRAAIVEFCAIKQQTFIGRKRSADGTSRRPNFTFCTHKKNPRQRNWRKEMNIGHLRNGLLVLQPTLIPPLLIMLFHVECLQKGASWSHGEAVIHLFCVVLFCLAFCFIAGWKYTVILACSNDFECG